MTRIFATILALVAMSIPTLAQNVEVTNEALIEVVTVDADGKETITYEPAEVVAPGDAILYRITYKNVGTEPVEGIVLQSQIPSDLIITEDSAEADGLVVQYSIDGGASFANRGDLVVTTPEGEKRPAEAADLTNVLWQVGETLAAEASGSVSFRGVVK